MKSVSRRTLMLGTAALASAPLLLRSGGAAWAASPSIAWDKAKIPADYPERAIGDPKAPVAIIEYSSLTCPHCAHFHVETLPKLKTDFIDTGKVYFVMRDFPLDQLALAASMVTRRAPEPMFFKLIEVLFGNQVKWARAENPAAALRQYGILAGMSGETVDAALHDNALMKAILAVRSDAGDSYGVDSTPSFIVKGEKHAGALPYDAFADMIQKAMGS